MAKVPKSVTVLVDSREQCPLYFPANIEWYPSRGGKSTRIAVKTEVVRLDAGDYYLKGYEDDSGWERKYTLRELMGNFFSPDYRRASSAFQRFIESTEVPYLLLDMSAMELLTPTLECPDPGRILDALFDHTRRLGLRLVLGGSVRTPTQRRKVGELVLRIMLSHALRHDAGAIDLDLIQKSMENARESDKAD